VHTSRDSSVPGRFVFHGRDGVLSANRAPVLNAIADRTIAEGQPLAVTAVAHDPDPGQLLTYALVGPAGATINPVSGAIAWTPRAGQLPGVYTFTVTAIDNGEAVLSAATTFHVTFLGVAPEVHLAEAVSFLPSGALLATAGTFHDPGLGP